MGRISEGQLLEQSIFQNLRVEHKLSFYNKDNASEIDFIVDDKVAIEVKTSMSRQDIANLKKRSRILGIDENYIITKQYNDNLEAIPVTEL